MKHQRGEGVDPAKRPQAGDGRPQPLIFGDAREPLVQRLAPGAQTINRGQRVDERQLGRRLLELLTREPLTVALVPRCRFEIDAALDEQQLGDPMARAPQIAPDALARPDQVPAGSSQSGGTSIALSWPASSSRASSSASLRSLFTRSAAARGVLPGAQTCIAIPARSAARVNPNP